MISLPKVLLLAGILASSVSAQADVVLYGFNDGSFDLWTANPAHGATGFTTSYAAPLPQVTEGTAAAGFTGGAWYDGGSELLSPTITSFTGVFATLAGNTQIGIDCTQLGLDSATYAGYQNFSFNLVMAGSDHLGNPFSVELQQRDFNNQTPTTLFYDYSTVAGGDITAGTVQSLSFAIQTFSAGGLGGGTTPLTPANSQLAMDNFRVIGAVPEPATYAMMAAGALGLMTLALCRRHALE